MSIRLDSFRYLPRGPDGWGTQSLHFGEMFTAVQGNNGTGKTPIMKGILQALGHEVELPPEVVSRCEYVEVVLGADSCSIVITRLLASRFEIRVNDGTRIQLFENQAEYAKWFTALFSAESPQLTNKQNEASELYASLLLPAIWVDQDHGWTTDYWTPPNRNFIKDQRQEVIRYLVAAPPRHPFRQRSQYDAAKEELERTQKAVDLQRFVVERLRSNEQLQESEEPNLLARREQLREELAANSDAIEAIRSATSFIDREIVLLERQREECVGKRTVLIKRKGQLNLVFAELDGEEEILTANVQATDVFRQFCGRDDCQMFSTSERSFGRSLLFLKDQLKDLRTSGQELGNEVELIDAQIATLDVVLKIKRTERMTSINSSPQADVLVKLSTLTGAVVNIELRLAKLQQYSSELKKFEKLLMQLDQAESEVAQLRPGRGRGISVIDDVRRMLGDSMHQWLTTLGTQNTSSAEFDEDFLLFVDGERFSGTTHQSGSTRTRIVLAFHAALLEVSLARNGNHPGWLFFDAPKQHELNQQDFDAYTERLVNVAAKYPNRVQVVFSVADLKTQLEVGDVVWAPEFQVGDQLRFLGPV